MTSDLSKSWIADRTKSFDSSGIRKVFDLAAKIKNPINLSIGQPDFDVPENIKRSCIDAIEAGKNGYAPTQGIPALRERLQNEVDNRFGHDDRQVIITSGTSGGLMLGLLSMINPGDEVILFDPYFVMYPALIQLCGGVPIFIDTYPDFRIDPNHVAKAITPKTKLILFNSPSNPTGVTASVDEVRGLAELANHHGVALISDEIYSGFLFDGELATPANYNPETIVIDGFSKSYGMTGWRLGYMHGPSALMQTILKLQQYSFVCAPTPVQWSALAALDTDMSGYVADYRSKRDRIVAGLQDDFELVVPGGAFYLFPKAPGGDASAFVNKALERDLLILPGSIFSRRNSHFRISFAASDETLDRGIEALKSLAQAAV